MCFPIHGSRVLKIILFCTTFCLQPNNFIGENVPKAPNLIGYMWENMWRLKVTSMFKNIQRSVFVVLSRIRKTTNYFLQLKNILFFFIRFVLYTRYDSVRPSACTVSNTTYTYSMYRYTIKTKIRFVNQSVISQINCDTNSCAGRRGRGGENRFTVFIGAHGLLCNQWTILQQWFTARLKGPPEPS